MNPRFLELKELAQSKLLPGWEELLSRKVEVSPYLEECEKRCLDALKDRDEVLFERAARRYMKGWRRINELLAQEYMEKNPDPTGWELRYLRWMRPGYIEFDSRLGRFYIILGKPDKRAPTDAPCFTVDEALVLLDPIVSKVVNEFGAFPIKAGDIEPPGAGEFVDHIFVDEEGVSIRTEIGEIGRGQRKYDER